MNSDYDEQHPVDNPNILLQKIDKYPTLGNN